MGLDNIPEPYPCEGKISTIRTQEDKIDCEAMRKKGVGGTVKNMGGTKRTSVPKKRR